jgi:hypothetical protein
MNQMTTEFGDRLERQCANDHGEVQNRPKRREFNVNRAIKRVNTDVDKFVYDNADMSDVDFKDVSMGYRECFG